MCYFRAKNRMEFVLVWYLVWLSFNAKHTVLRYYFNGSSWAINNDYDLIQTGKHLPLFLLESEQNIDLARSHAKVLHKISEILDIQSVTDTKK